MKELHGVPHFPPTLALASTLGSNTTFLIGICSRKTNFHLRRGFGGGEEEFEEIAE